jgi:hypothetical protein
MHSKIKVRAFGKGRCVPWIPLFPFIAFSHWQNRGLEITAPLITAQQTFTAFISEPEQASVRLKINPGTRAILKIRAVVPGNRYRCIHALE